MIFVAAGTQDARELIAYLLMRGFVVAASVVSDYGRLLLPAHENLIVNAEPLDGAALKNYLLDRGITAVVDATHPYAAQISATAMKICRELDLPYLRYERPAWSADYDKVERVADYEAAAAAAAKYARSGETVFLTTGSRSLPIFCNSPALRERRIVARVLPTTKVLAACEDLGILPKDIVAMQGPFSQGLNEELFRAYEAKVIVTKDAGRLGGVDTKLSAAARLSLPVVMIERPKLNYEQMANDFEQVATWLKGIEQ